MFRGIVQSGVILATIVAFYAADVWLMRRFDPLRVKGSSRAWDYTAFLIALGSILVIQPTVWPGLGLYTTAWWGLAFQVLGLLGILAGLALHVWARTHLAQYYGEREEVQQGQNLIDSGPYAYVRHPIYTSYFLFAIGLLLVNPSLPMLLASAYGFIDFSLAARREEKLLAADLPGYADFMARRPRFLPRWGRRS